MTNKQRNKLAQRAQRTLADIREDNGRPDCAFCGRPASIHHLITSGMNDRGCLNVFAFCLARHLQAWRSQHPFPLVEKSC